MRVKAEKDNGLGRLNSLGITEPWLAAFYLPESWGDYRTVLTSTPNPSVTHACFSGSLSADPQMRFDSVPRAVCRLALPGGGLVGFTLFGDCRELGLCAGKKLAVYGEIQWLDDQCWVKAPTIVPDEWVGRVSPRYKGKARVIRPETVRDRLVSLLDDSIPVAANWLRTKIPVVSGPLYKPLEAILLDAHLPSAPEDGLRAHRWLDRAAAYFVADSLEQIASKRKAVPSFRLGKLDDWAIRMRVSALPFTLTDEQEVAIKEILGDMCHGTMHRMLSGGVGSGKTAVYGTVAAVCADSGARVAVLVPNQALAKQIHSDFDLYLP